MEGNLTGNYFVRALRPAFQDVHRLLPRARDRGELRRQTLKLRFWPERYPLDDNGTLLDLDWSWIQSLKGKKIGELRIGDEIGGCRNLRVIFFDPERTDPLPMLWVLSVIEKKRDDFTSHQISNFNLRRLLVLERFYQNE